MNHQNCTVGVATPCHLLIKIGRIIKLQNELKKKTQQ